EKVTDNIFLNPFAQYDATAYLYIAEYGYTADFGSYRTGNYHWYPLYPLLIRVFSFIGYPLAAFLIANIASFFAVTMLWLLVRDELGKRAASKTIIYMLLFPTAFYFTMMYTEALFLFLSVSMFYFAKKQNWIAVGIFGFLVSLSRMQGALLLIPVAYMYMRTVDFKLSKISRKALYLLGIPVGLATFMFYEYLITGDPLIQFKSAVMFGKQLSLPWTGFEFSLRAIFMDTTLINVAYHVYTLLITVAFIVLAYVSYKKLKHEYTIYYVLSLLIIIVSSNLFGATRYFLMAFPAFMALSLVDDKNKFLKYGIIVVYALFVLLMAGSIVLHVTERISTPILYTPMF
ncbi:MAG: glycosyltransferase family 39 protein, partial [Candidatus Aenigmatarchaeota archaeon]